MCKWFDKLVFDYFKSFDVILDWSCIFDNCVGEIWEGIGVVIFFLVCGYKISFDLS